MLLSTLKWIELVKLTIFVGNHGKIGDKSAIISNYHHIWNPHIPLNSTVNECKCIFFGVYGDK